MAAFKPTPLDVFSLSSLTISPPPPLPPRSLLDNSGAGSGATLGNFYAKKNYDNIVVTGHSLGGAASNFAFWDLLHAKASGVLKAKIHHRSFASPRSFFKVATRTVNGTDGKPEVKTDTKASTEVIKAFQAADSKRIVGEGDVVPATPFSDTTFHVGEVYVLGGEECGVDTQAPRDGGNIFKCTVEKRELKSVRECPEEVRNSGLMDTAAFKKVEAVLRARVESAALLEMDTTALLEMDREAWFGGASNWVRDQANRAREQANRAAKAIRDAAERVLNGRRRAAAARKATADRLRKAAADRARAAAKAAADAAAKVKALARAAAKAAADAAAKAKALAARAFGMANKCTWTRPVKKDRFGHPLCKKFDHDNHETVVKLFKVVDDSKAKCQLLDAKAVGYNYPESTVLSLAKMMLRAGCLDYHSIPAHMARMRNLVEGGRFEATEPSSNAKKPSRNTTGNTTSASSRNKGTFVLSAAGKAEKAARLAAERAKADADKAASVFSEAVRAEEMNRRATRHHASESSDAQTIADRAAAAANETAAVMTAADTAIKTAKQASAYARWRNNNAAKAYNAALQAEDNWRLHPELKPGAVHAEHKYRKVEGVGAQGAQCRCPDGSLSWVGDNNDACKSLACEGGTVVGVCGSAMPEKFSGYKMTCGTMVDADAAVAFGEHAAVTTFKHSAAAASAAFHA